jgi:hypothetical protein
MVDMGGVRTCLVKTSNRDAKQINGCEPWLCRWWEQRYFFVLPDLGGKRASFDII